MDEQFEEALIEVSVPMLTCTDSKGKTLEYPEGDQNPCTKQIQIVEDEVEYCIDAKGQLQEFFDGEPNPCYWPDNHVLASEEALFLKDTTAAIETTFVSDMAKFGAPLAIVALAVYGVI